MDCHLHRHCHHTFFCGSLPCEEEKRKEKEGIVFSVFEFVFFRSGIVCSRLGLCLL